MRVTAGRFLLRIICIQFDGFFLLLGAYSPNFYRICELCVKVVCGIKHVSLFIMKEKKKIVIYEL